jgi:NADPH-dependent 2,4-dienoyl-CoA reductase/sulfur reductase-like enzyme
MDHSEDGGVVNRIVIVGASAGGLATAEALRRSSFGGPITLIGDELERPYDRPPLSKQLLAGTWAPDRLALRADDDLDALALDFRLGTAATGLRAAQKEVVLADGSRLPYDGLVIATGVRPRRLRGCAELHGLHVLRTLSDALALQARLRKGARLVIVGAGFVGAEVAATARGLHVDVTMLEAAKVPLAHAIGEPAGRFLMGLHSDHGVDVRTSTAVAEILSEQGAVTGVRLADATVVPADDVLVAVGSAPNTEWLRDSELTVDNGVVCDEFGAAAPSVYAVGDVARWHNPTLGAALRIEHRTNAAEQGMAVAHNLLNPNDQWSLATVPYFWSDQYDTKIQAFGHLSDHDEALVLEHNVSARQLLVAYRKDDRLAGALAAGTSPKALRMWRGLVAARLEWTAALVEATSV